MMKKFFLVLLITIVTANPVSIGSCLKYSADGQSCEQCILNYHLNEGSCYVDILGCIEYQFGNICHQCDKNYILVNNMCCDMVCMSKIFSKFKKEVKQEVIANNTEILNELIPFAQTQYLKDTSGRLVAIEVKEYQDAKRFFLLYEFYESEFYSKRLIVDYVIRSKKYIIVEWSLVKNSWNYGVVEWTEVEDDASILLFYPSLYPSGQKYDQVVARKAILSEVSQYEIATLIGTKTVIRTLYVYQGEQVILRETETVQSIPTSTPQIGSTSTTSTNNSSTETSSSSPTSSTSSSPSSNETQPSQPSSSTFSAYELKYQGQDILAELDVNDPLIAALDQVRANEKWNHSLTLVSEAGKIPGVIEFVIVGQNKATGSIVKYTVKYNQPTSEAFIISMTEEITQPESMTSSSSSPTSTSTSSTSTSSTSTSSPSTSTPTAPIISLAESEVYVVEEGCSTHTYYMSPFTPDIESMADTLKTVRQKAMQQNSSAPFIAAPTLKPRRLVISENCEGSMFREVAYVEGDIYSTRQYFTYYFEVQEPVKQWYYLGTKNKSQTMSVFTNPYAYPIYVSDPSFLLYPSASLYYQNSNSFLFSNKLSPEDLDIFTTLTPVATSEKDRLMGKMSRFAIDGYTPENSKFRMTGWRISQIPDGWDGDNDMVAMVCSEAMITESYLIGTTGTVNKSEPTATTQQTTTAPTGEAPVSTSISSSVLGDKTVTTTNVDTLLNEDEILKNILEWLIGQKPTTSNYEPDTIQISEYSQALEYHLIMREKNLDQSPDFSPTSELRAVIIHDKVSHENTLISFEIIPIASPSTDSQPVDGTSPSASSPAIKTPADNYVVVDLKPAETTQSPTSPSSSNTSSTSTPSTTDGSNTTSPTNPTQSTTTPSGETAPLPDPKTIQEQERVKQMIDSIIQQLESTYQISSPVIEQALQQINDAQNTVKLTVVVQNPTTNEKYSVVSIAPLESQNEPIIESVKPVAQQIIEKIIEITKPVTEPEAPKTCVNKTINSQGQEVCLDETTSSQVDIQPGQTPTTTTTNSTDASVPTSSNTSSSTSPSISQPVISEPSTSVTQLFEEKSFEETVQSDGEVRKIYVNPLMDEISDDVKSLVETVKVQEGQLQKNQSIVETPVIKVSAIELAATNVYVHYAVTLKIIYSTVTVIRRYYYVVPVPSNTTPTSSSPKVYMGHQDLPANFDPTVKENRALTDFSSLVPSNTTQTTYKTVIDALNNQYKTTFTVLNVVYYKYRVFPLGNYSKVTIKNQTVVGNLHLISNNQPQTNQVLNWHQVPIEQITSQTSTQPAPTVNTTSSTSPNGTTSTQTSTSTSTNSSTSSPSPTSPSTGSNTTTTSPSSSTQTSPSTPVAPLPAPEELINQVETTTPEKVIISLSLEEKLAEVLKHLSQVKADELTGGSLEQYASTEDKSIDGTLNAIQFDLYFLKFISDTLLREFICSIIRHEADGKIEIALFLSNDINLADSKPNATNNTTPTNSTPQVTVETQVKQEQVAMNSDFVLVDPNELNYPEAISLIEQDPSKSEFDEIIDLNSIPSNVEDIIRFLRAKYTTIQNAGGLRIIRSTKTSNVQRFRIYFFKEQPNNNYQIYRAVLDLNTETVQAKYLMVSFEMYANNHQLAIKPVTSDESLKDDTDVAYGYVIVDLATINTNPNIQKILNHLNNKYHQIVFGKNVTKIEELKLLDGRINYKILFRDPVDLSEFKFIIFYQPQLDKVLVLNSVNLPHHSQYNQLTLDQQKSDSLFSSVVTYLNSIHPEINGFSVKSASKAVESSFSEYQLVVENKNKKYKSLIRIASNNVDLTEINFSELIEVSLDHYKLDQFDEMFIMNYQKLTNEELRTNSKLRIVLSFLYNTKKINSDAQFLGAAYKPYGLGFLYKTFFRIGLSQEVVAAEIYIEAYSDKVTLKNFKNIDFTQNLLAITVESATLSKMISLIKQKTSFTEFTIQSSFAKDFLYGTLYKFSLNTKSGNFDVFVYHDHSTEEISPLFIQENQVENQCVYENSACISCRSILYRVYNNKCIQKIQNCEKYQETTEYCAICGTNSELINGVCIEKLNCGVLCQIVSL